MVKTIDGKKLLQDAKNKVNNKKETNNMKTPKKTIIITVLLTITTLAAIGGLLYAGFQFGIGYEKGLNQQITTQAKSLVTNVAEPKK